MIGARCNGLILKTEDGQVLATETASRPVRYDGPLFQSGNYLIEGFSCYYDGNMGVNLQRVSNPVFAASIVCGERRAGVVGTVGDRRTFAFEGTVGSSVTLTVSRGGSGDIQPLVEVYDPDGFLVADASTTDKEAKITALTILRGGRYTILVSDTSTRTGSFSIMLQCQ
ncbi:MAG: hypothetical protein HY314_04635 [Acidobacteria bacterium]|nr:hypothetical protein [Acidobacteriota bacterium]